MQTKENLLEPLLERAEEYSKTSFELLKLKSVEKVSEIGSIVISRLILIAVLSLSFLCINEAVALWLGELLGKNYYGFFIIGVFYGLVGLMLFFFHPSIKARVNNSIIAKICN